MGNRIVELDTILNLRDAGGYRTADGRMVRRGRVYRSGQLSRLTPAAWRVVREELGIGGIWDLRSADEMRRMPTAVPEGVRVWHRPVGNSGNRWLRLLHIFRHRHHLHETMRQTYVSDFVDGGAATMGQILIEVGAADGPVLIHCTAGKDRTGLTVALLLRLLGVPEPTVVDDYALSNRWTEPLAASLAKEFAPLYVLGFTPAQLRPLLLADPDYLLGALRRVDEQYGGVEAYLQGPGGMSAEQIVRLRARFLR